MGRSLAISGQRFITFLGRPVIILKKRIGFTLTLRRRQEGLDTEGQIGRWDELKKERKG